MNKKVLVIFGSILITGFLLFTFVVSATAAPKHVTHKAVTYTPVTFPLKSGHIDQLQPAATTQRFQPAATINQVQN